jgi:hypothetical protein
MTRYLPAKFAASLVILASVAAGSGSATADDATKK